jgi:hypothetical protein
MALQNIYIKSLNILMIFIIHATDSIFQPAPLVLEAATFDDQTDSGNFLFKGKTLLVDRSGFKVYEPEFIRCVSKIGVLKIEMKETQDSNTVNLVWPRGTI